MANEKRKRKGGDWKKGISERSRKPRPMAELTEEERLLRRRRKLGGRCSQIRTQSRRLLGNGHLAR